LSERYRGFDAMMERYKEEMRRIYEARRPETGPPPQTAADALESVNAGAVQAAVQPPSTGREPEGTPESEDASEPKDAPEPEDAPEDAHGPEDAQERATAYGYIRVMTFTAHEAVPVAGASVAVSREKDGSRELVCLSVTDESGRTPAMKVEAVPASLSQEPGDPHPFAAYIVEAAAAGYCRVDGEPVDVFGGEESEVPLELLPLPEEQAGEEGDA